MNISMQYFLLVVDMQSISKAAEKLFVTQQNLSNHIKRLEKEYGVLFTRKPKFMLTPSGEALYETLKHIRILESGLRIKLQDIQDNSVGLVRIGTHTARARLFLPSAAAAFQSKYPRVQLEVVHSDTAVCEKLLENGDIDLFLGVDTKPHREFSYIHLKNDLVSPPQIVVGDFAIQLQLARENLGACFCPQMFLADEQLLFQKADTPLNKYTVEGLSVHNRLDLVLNKRMYHSHYVDELVDILKETILRCFI